MSGAIAVVMVSLRSSLLSWSRRRASDRLERALLAARQLDAGAGAALDEFPRIALEVSGRGALAGRARSGRAIVLALQGDAEAFFLFGRDGRVALGLGQRSSSGQGRERGRHGAGENERGHGKFGRHWSSPVRDGIAWQAKAHGSFRSARSPRYREAVTKP